MCRFSPVAAALLVLFSSVYPAPVPADEKMAPSLSSSAAGTIRLAQAMRQYRGFGVHQCQSSKSIGHKCGVTGIFTDCNAAYHQMRLDDCCPGTKDGGKSIKFAMDSCGAYFSQPADRCRSESNKIDATNSACMAAANAKSDGTAKWEATRECIRQTSVARCALVDQGVCKYGCDPSLQR